MRNLYTNMALGSYRKVSQISNNKNIIRENSSENQNVMSMRLHSVGWSVHIGWWLPWPTSVSDIMCTNSNIALST